MSYSKKLIAENVANGVAHEPYWLGKLKSKYPTIDGIFFWELKDFEKQKHELIFGQNSNKKIGQPQVDIVDIKTKYLQRFLIT